MPTDSRKYATQTGLDRARSGKTYDGDTLSECEKRWEPIGTIASKGWRGIRHIGVYRLRLGGIVYIGRVIYRQGFHWRMQQYDSGSYAGNTTPAARKIHAKRKKVRIEIIRMKSAKATTALEKELIAKYDPAWNSHLKK